MNEFDETQEMCIAEDRDYVAQGILADAARRGLTDRALAVARLATRNVRADTTGHLTARRALLDAARYELDVNGDPQVFPFDDASTAVIREFRGLDDSDHSEHAEMVREVAGSVREHRDGFRAHHTADCRSDLYRGLCH